MPLSKSITPGDNQEILQAVGKTSKLKVFSNHVDTLTHQLLGHTRKVLEQAATTFQLLMAVHIPKADSQTWVSGLRFQEMSLGSRLLGRAVFLSSQVSEVF